MVLDDSGATSAMSLRGHRHADGRVLQVALGSAVLLHLLALTIPLPRRETALPPPPPPEPGLVLSQLHLPPPAPAPPVALQASVLPRMLAVPDPEPPPGQLEPVSEPVEWNPAPVVATEPWSLVAPLPPPPVLPQVLEQGTEGLELPVALPGRAEPVYPAMAMRARKQGRVSLLAVVDIAGRVVSIEVVQAPNPDLGFSEAAVEAVRTWRYTPGSYRGRPVPVRLKVEVDFLLE